ncbi:hypothetical protein CCAX7_43320 [Capsulimonas corticalis]|uniref:Uncharacterized protein n=1 Tax=Capsulimonas corticalis TaxID=2219043 RepID=A0A402CXF9_9BACT|nr:hypothetical protein [Capsulimonas corticalis]BDI32281.1 hypothetical protein CCAX7_43320 [Capsulimonas corticalis]
MTIVRAPQSIIGYHGCDLDIANRLLNGEPFHKSANDYDWLGSGVYFWEYAPYRAWDWAQKRYGDQAAVLRAEIVLGDCLNLLDTDYFSDLGSVYNKLAHAFASQGVALPFNSRGANRLDRIVIDKFCEEYTQGGGDFDTVRSCFAEGAPLYDGSKILSLTHTQIAVRNAGCIQDLKLVHFE